MLIARLSACGEWDGKKIIAYSTLRQLGLILVVLRQSVILGFYHILAHACFKALMFICMGYIINSSLHTQDSRGLGKGFRFMGGVVVVGFFTRVMSLSGLMFLSGLYSKECLLNVGCKICSLFEVIYLLCFGLRCYYGIRLFVSVIGGGMRQVGG